MSTITVTRVTEHYEHYTLSFFADECGAGFSFDCTSEGQIIPIGPYARYNLHAAVDGYLNGELDMEIVDYSRDLKHYEATCTCSAEMVAYGCDDFVCKSCQREFNIWGQELRPNWRNNRSNYDDEIGDMEGYELSCADY